MKTEKRFDVIDDGFSRWIVDTTLTEDKHEGTLYDAYDMCHKLNELYEENEQLRKYNRQLQERLEKINGGYGLLTHRNGLTANEWLIESQERELKKKNEQIKCLKEEREQLQKKNKGLGDDLYNCRLNKNIIGEKLKLWQDTLAEYDIYTIKDFAESFELDSEISKEKDEKIKELEVKVLNLELKNEELMKNE